MVKPSDLKGSWVIIFSKLSWESGVTDGFKIGLILGVEVGEGKTVGLGVSRIGGSF